MPSMGINCSVHTMQLMARVEPINSNYSIALIGSLLTGLSIELRGDIQNNVDPYLSYSRLLDFHARFAELFRFYVKAMQFLVNLRQTSLVFFPFALKLLS